MTVGYDKLLYILPFDHRGSFQTKMFGWKGALTPAQTAEIADAKQVVYEGFKEAVAAGVPKKHGRITRHDLHAIVISLNPSGLLGIMHTHGGRRNKAPPARFRHRFGG